MSASPALLPPGYRIRAARPGEDALLPDIENRAGEMFAASPHPEVGGHDAGSPALFAAHRALGLCFVVADEADMPVGFATCGQLDAALHLYELSVDPANGRKGLGRALIETVCAEAAARGLAAVTLSTFEDVAWNAPFYARVGFRILTADELTPALHLVANHERSLGLRNRCIMRRDI